MRLHADIWALRAGQVPPFRAFWPHFNHSHAPFEERSSWARGGDPRIRHARALNADTSLSPCCPRADGLAGRPRRAAPRAGGTCPGAGFAGPRPHPAPPQRPGRAAPARPPSRMARGHARSGDPQSAPPSHWQYTVGCFACQPLTMGDGRARAFSKSRLCHPEQVLRAFQRGERWPAKGPGYT